ncbi:MAG: hypothetical protein ABSG05_00745 [Candidatus Pacearchaeota archaeon]|jgi:hypothetical protein
MDTILGIVILDAVLLLIGVFMSWKELNKKHTDVVWKLVEYVTMALVGYLLATGRIV